MEASSSNDPETLQLALVVARSSNVIVETGALAIDVNEERRMGYRMGGLLQSYIGPRCPVLTQQVPPVDHLRARPLGPSGPSQAPQARRLGDQETSYPHANHV